MVTTFGLLWGKPQNGPTRNLQTLLFLTSNSIVEPVVAIKVEVMSLATIITEEAYLLLGEEERSVVYIDSVITYLQLIDDEDAYTEAARYLYLGVNYDPFIAGHPSCVSFRVYYAVSGLVPSLGHETDDWLLPEEC